MILSKIKQSRSILTVVFFLHFAHTMSAAINPIVPKGVALTNRLGTEINFQILATLQSHWGLNAAISPESTITVNTGCIRFRSEPNQKIKYYLLESEHRYAFDDQDGQLVLVFNGEADPSALRETTAENPACVASKN